MRKEHALPLWPSLIIVPARNDFSCPATSPSSYVFCLPSRTHRLWKVSIRFPDILPRNVAADLFSSATVDSSISASCIKAEFTCQIHFSVVSKSHTNTSLPNVPRIRPQCISASEAAHAYREVCAPISDVLSSSEDPIVCESISC